MVLTRERPLENYRKYFSEYVSFPYSRHVQELIDSLKRADGEFSINQLTYKRDIMTVDSAFLVNHIEWAFKVWREQPWGKHVDFDTFCEYILPYRIGDEPLSLWRKEIYECYSPILDEFRKTDEADNPKVAAQLLMDTLRKANYRNTALFPVYSFGTGCTEMAYGQLPRVYGCHDICVAGIGHSVRSR